MIKYPIKYGMPYEDIIKLPRSVSEYYHEIRLIGFALDEPQRTLWFTNRFKEMEQMLLEYDDD